MVTEVSLEVGAGAGVVAGVGTESLAAGAWLLVSMIVGAGVVTLLLGGSVVGGLVGVTVGGVSVVGVVVGVEVGVEVGVDVGVEVAIG